MGLLRGVILGPWRLGVGGVAVILGLLRGTAFGLPGDEIDRISEGLEWEPDPRRSGGTTGGLEGGEIGEADESCRSQVCCLRIWCVRPELLINDRPQPGKEHGIVGGLT